MSFDGSGEAYGQFMGRYSEPLAAQFLLLVGDRLGSRVIDVGCGPGALTAALAAQLGPAGVAAVDPSESFVAAARARLPGVEVQRAHAEQLPFPDGAFDSALAQLVVHFMTEPVAGIAEMARVTKTGGVVAACVWDHAGGRSPLSVFWRAVLDIDPTAHDESDLPGIRDGHLVELFRRAGLGDVSQHTLTVQAACADFESWWHPYTLGVGPAGDYVNSLGPPEREALRARCAEYLPTAPFTIEATAWAAIGYS